MARKPWRHVDTLARPNHVDAIDVHPAGMHAVQSRPCLVESSLAGTGRLCS